MVIAKQHLKVAEWSDLRVSSFSCKIQVKWLLKNWQSVIKHVGGEVSTQTEENLPTIQSLQTINKRLKERIFGIHIIRRNDSHTKFFTGLPTWSMFFYVFMFLSPFITPSRSICLEDEFFLTLLKLRLNLFATDLASRFGVSIGLTSKMFQKWLTTMFIWLQFLITCPSERLCSRTCHWCFSNCIPTAG